MADTYQEANKASEKDAGQTEIKRIMISKAALPFVARGGHIFTGQVIGADPEILQGEDVMVVDDRGRALIRGFAQAPSFDAIPEEAPQEMLKKVVVSDAAAVSIARGGHVFARQIIDADKSIAKGDWISVVDRKSRPLITAYSAVSAKDMIAKEKGNIAVAT